jgi:CRISPR/Cas system-associated exonuclease Cas4 (RecB family)
MGVLDIGRRILAAYTTTGSVTRGGKKLARNMMSLQRFEFTPILGWSASRYDMFQSCKRHYFYNYYGKYSRELLAKISALKKMTSIPLEIGCIVHDTIAVLLRRLLKSDGAIDQPRFVAYAIRKTSEYCGRKRFSEVHYGEVDKIDESEIAGVVEKCLLNLLQSDRFTWLKEMATSNKLEWVIEPAGYGETRIDGMKAYCKVDFLFPVGDKTFIIDWKTGKAHDEKHRKQLVAYSSWATFHFSKDPADIVSIIAHLQPSYEEMEVTVNEFDIQEFSTQVRTETEEMYSFCVDVEENIPKRQNAFTQTTNKKICAYCNFRELCVSPTL